MDTPAQNLLLFAAAGEIALVGFLLSCMVGVAYVVIRQSWRAHVRDELAAVEQTLAAEFPDLVAGWGGPAVLKDAEAVRRIVINLNGESGETGEVATEEPLDTPLVLPDSFDMAAAERDRKLQLAEHLHRIAQRQETLALLGEPRPFPLWQALPLSVVPAALLGYVVAGWYYERSRDFSGYRTDLSADKLPVAILLGIGIFLLATWLSAWALSRWPVYRLRLLKSAGMFLVPAVAMGGIVGAAIGISLRWPNPNAGRADSIAFGVLGGIAVGAIAVRYYLRRSPAAGGGAGKTVERGPRAGAGVPGQRQRLGRWPDAAAPGGRPTGVATMQAGVPEEEMAENTADVEEDVTAGDLERQREYWTKPSLLEHLQEQCGKDSAEVARRLMAWAQERMPFTTYGRRGNSGGIYPKVKHEGQKYALFAITGGGEVAIQFASLRMKRPFEDEALRRQLLDMLNQISTVTMPVSKIGGYPAFPLGELQQETDYQKFLQAAEWFIQQIRSC